MTKAEEKAEWIGEAVLAAARAIAIANKHPDPDAYVANVAHAHETGELPEEPAEEQSTEG